MSPTDTTKRELLEQALQAGLTRVSVANFIEGVMLPAHLDGNVWVVLQLSARFGPWSVPVFHDDRFEVVLSFGEHGNCLCVIPYRAIGTVTDRQGIVYGFSIAGEVKPPFGAVVERRAGRDVATSKEQRPLNPGRRAMKGAQA